MITFPELETASSCSRYNMARLSALVLLPNFAVEFSASVRGRQSLLIQCLSRGQRGSTHDGRRTPKFSPIIPGKGIFEYASSLDLWCPESLPLFYSGRFFLVTSSHFSASSLKFLPFSYFSSSHFRLPHFFFTCVCVCVFFLSHVFLIL